MRVFITALLAFSLFAKLSSQEFNYQTHTYHHGDTASLELDLFYPDSIEGKAPFLLFIHGGGFSGGKRQNGHPFCQFLSDNGIAAATMSYTLSMKGKSFSCDGIQAEKIRTIQLAAYQARLATLWLLERADSLGIDTTQFFIAGSSAGAETALQAAFWDTTSVNYFPDTLQNGFSYAGVISGAGALLDINMINERTKIPVLCYHGTCDPLVPYHIAPHHYCPQIATGYMMMFGGLAIHERLTALNETSQLMTYCGEGHKHAGTAFNAPGSINTLEFIERVIAGEQFNIHRVFDNGAECDLYLDFIHCFRGL